MSLFLQPIEPIRISQPWDLTVSRLMGQLGLLIVKNVLLKSENAELRQERDDFMDMFVPPWRG